MGKAVSKEFTAGGRFDFFLDSGANIVYKNDEASESLKFKNDLRILQGFELLCIEVIKLLLDLDTFNTK